MSQAHGGLVGGDSTWCCISSSRYDGICSYLSTTWSPVTAAQLYSEDLRCHHTAAVKAVRMNNEHLHQLSACGVNEHLHQLSACGVNEHLHQLSACGVDRSQRSIDVDAQRSLHDGVEAAALSGKARVQCPVSVTVGRYTRAQSCRLGAWVRGRVPPLSTLVGIVSCIAEGWDMQCLHQV